MCIRDRVGIVHGLDQVEFFIVAGDSVHRCILGLEIRIVSDADLKLDDLEMCIRDRRSAASPAQESAVLQYPGNHGKDTFLSSSSSVTLSFCTRCV